MGRKIVITKYHSKMFLMDFSESVCTGISVLADSEKTLLGNIYIGRVENVVSNINAAFIEIQKGIKCYYSLQENKKHIFLNRKNNKTVNVGDKLLVQVCREPIKTKPATVTSKIEIPGKFAVLSSDVEGVLISSKIKKSSNAQALKECIEKELTDKNVEAGIIVRTNAASVSMEIVLKEINQLVDKYNKVLQRAEFGMFYEKLNSGIPEYCSYINDIPEKDLEEIVTDNKDVYDTIVSNVPEIDMNKIRFYDDELLELYKLYSFETIIKHATDRKVWLKSGGYLVIDQTEAMTVIDVNSGKQTVKKRKADTDAVMEDAFFKVNMEAAEELSRQLRMRNLSGIIIVDFINMKLEDHNQKLLSAMSHLLKKDPVTASVIDITKLGLMEITRKNQGKCLAEQLHAKSVSEE